jgi:hypothetical protein
MLINELKNNLPDDDDDDEYEEAASTIVMTPTFIGYYENEDE